MKHLIDILRPLNCATAGVAALLGYWLSSGEQPLVAFLLFASTFLICGAGNTINDFFDAPIDKKLKKHRPIPSGKISPGDALNYSGLLFLLGILLAFQVSYLLLAIAIVASILLIAYPMALKQRKWLGNLVVSSLVALPFLYGSVAAELFSPSVAVLAVAAFLANLAREIVKDIEDFKAKEKATIPKMFGRENAARIAIVLLAMAVGTVLSGLGYTQPLFIALSIGFLFCASSRLLAGEKDASSVASKYIKIAMLLILLAFILGKITLS